MTTSDEMTMSAVDRAVAAMRAQNLGEAHRIAEEALEAGLEHPFLLKVRGLWLHQSGRFSDAIRAFHHARELDSSDAMILNGIAASLSSMGEHTAALKMLDASIELAPEMVTTNYLRGWTYEAVSDYAKARAAYERTLSLSPRHVQALAGLATTAYRLGDFATARSSAEQALEFHPLQPTAMTAVALVEIAEGRPELAEKRIRALLAAPVPDLARAVASGVLGDALDAQSRTAEAFEAYLAENAILQIAHRNVSAPLGAIVEDLRSLSARLEASTGRWTKTLAVQSADTARGHVFLLGFPRSGTTLVEQVLAAHPEIATLEEVDLLAEPTRRYLSEDDGVDALLGASDSNLAEFRDAYWKEIEHRGIDVGGKVFVDKLPFNTTKLPLIAKLFPQSRIVFALRDPRDVVFSCFRRHFDIRALTYEFLTLENAARLYDATMKIGTWSMANLPIEYRILRLERLLEEFDGEIAALCDFLDLNYVDAMRDFAESAKRREILSLSAPQVRRGLDTSATGHWRFYKDQLSGVLPILAPWIEHFDYPPD